MELVKQRIAYYRQLCSKCEIRDEILEVIVPDSNPDFLSEIVTFSTCTTTDKSILSGSARISGELKASVQYAADASESMYTIEAASSFSYTIDAEKASPEDKLIAETTVLESKCEAINSRKLRIKVKLCINFSVMTVQSTEYSHDVVSDISENIYFKTEECDKTVCIDIAEKQIYFTDDIYINNDDMQAIQKIIRHDCIWSVSEIKTLSNKLMLRGIATLNLYGCSDNSWTIKKLSYTLPFSQVIECGNASENDAVDIRILSEGCKITRTQKDDNSFYLRCELSATAVAHVNRTLHIKTVKDMYSTEYFTDCQTVSTTLTVDTYDVKNDTAVSGRIDISDGADNVLFCNISPVCRYTNGCVHIKYYISLIYQDNLDTVKSAYSIIESDIEIGDSLLCSTISCTVDNIQTKTDAAGVLINFNAAIVGKASKNYSLCYVNNCISDKNTKRSSGRKYNLILKAFNENESIWSIAKQYGTTESAILSANNILDECELFGGKLIMIPFVNQ